MEKAKKAVVRKLLPENLERKIEHVYPEGYNPEGWDLLDEEEPLYTQDSKKIYLACARLRNHRHQRDY